MIDREWLNELKGHLTELGALMNDIIVERDQLKADLDAEREKSKAMQELYEEAHRQTALHAKRNSDLDQHIGKQYGRLERASGLLTRLVDALRAAEGSDMPCWHQDLIEEVEVFLD